MKKNQGIITAYALVFGAIALILLGGLLGLVLLQLKLSNQRRAFYEALEIAEAGVHYYRWCLNNEIEGICPLQKEYTNTSAVPLGTFSLQVDSRVSCGATLNHTITSTGSSYLWPEKTRQIRVLYGRPSVAQYAYLLNDNVWAGSDREIRGLYHSNAGIRMDGENQSLVTSAQEEWICTASFGCSVCPTSANPPCRIEGSQCVCPGVFTTTSNANPDLFTFPVPAFDFSGITIDLAQIKELTLAYAQQYYWPSSSQLDPEAKGYHFKFLNNGTFEVWIVTGLNSTFAYSLEEGWHFDDFTIASEYRYGAPIIIDPNCALIFAEDRLWVEGEVRGKVTLASANLINPNQDTDVILAGDINYAALDGSDGLSVIGERNVLIAPDSPNQMELRGIFIAQKGRFGRNHYPGNLKEKLEMGGSIISNGRVGTKWSSGGQIISGYLKRENYIDPNLIYNPPAFVPYVSPEFEIVNWEEIE